MGVDGGGTKCRTRLRSEAGDLLSEAEGGLANLYQDLGVAIATILATIEAALAQAGVTDAGCAKVHIALGLAGAVTEQTKTAVTRALQHFASVTVDVDAYAACLGAHDGAAGGRVIAGTRVAGVALFSRKRHWIGGFGFHLGDQGSGAILGRAALRRAVLTLD